MSGVRGARCEPFAVRVATITTRALNRYCALPIKKRASPASSGSRLFTFISRNSAGFSRRCSAPSRLCCLSPLLFVVPRLLPLLCLCLASASFQPVTRCARLLQLILLLFVIFRILCTSIRSSGSSLFSCRRSAVRSAPKI